MINRTFLVIISFFVFSLVANAQSLSPFVTFSSDGRTRMVVTNPLGEKTGNIGLATYDQASNASLELYSDIVNVNYDTPIVGQYSFDFKGDYDEQFRFRLVYLDPSGQYNELDLTRWANANATTTMIINLSLDASSNTYSFDSDQFSAPTGLVATPSAGQTTLSWNNVPSATGYSVYYKYNDYPYYGLLGTTATTTMVANVPYATDSGDESFPNDLHYFVVSANLADGTQTVLSQPVANDDRDGDRIRDWIETNTYNTNPDNSDSDGDSLNDFLEINLYRTDPNNSDSDGDGHTDSDELTNNTDPTLYEDGGTPHDSNSPQPVVVQTGSSSSGGGGSPGRYVCRDEQAINYERYGQSDESICIYPTVEVTISSTTDVEQSASTTDPFAHLEPSQKQLLVDLVIRIIEHMLWERLRST